MNDPVIDAYRRIVDAFKANDFALALAQCQHLLTARPGDAPEDARILFLAGSAARRLGQAETWVELFERSEVVAPGNPEALYEIGVGHRILGAPDKALAAFERVLTLDPNHAAAWLQFSALHRFTPGDPAFQALQALVDAPGAAAADTARAGFALAKAHEDLGDFDAAFAQLARANAVQRGLVAYDIGRDESFAARLRAAFAPARIERFAHTGHGDDAPVFIVGMPRSGTTLAEQILAAHPDAAGLGEILDLEQALNAAVSAGPPFPECLECAGPGWFADIGAAYAGRIAARAPAARRRVNKTPANFLYIGLIALALPGARIVHCRRDAMDTCFSNFATLFEAGPYFAYDLQELARYHNLYTATMTHWHALFPGRIFDLDYEALVARPETEIRRLLNFCDLEWDQACLRFHETRRPVETASNLQVRQPLHGRSVGRWRHYRPHLASLAAMLD